MISTRLCPVFASCWKRSPPIASWQDIRCHLNSGLNTYKARSSAERGIIMISESWGANLLKGLSCCVFSQLFLVLVINKHYLLKVILDCWTRSAAKFHKRPPLNVNVMALVGLEAQEPTKIVPPWPPIQSTIQCHSLTIFPGSLHTFEGHVDVASGHTAFLLTCTPTFLVTLGILDTFPSIFFSACFTLLTTSFKSAICVAQNDLGDTKCTKIN